MKFLVLALALVAITSCASKKTEQQIQQKVAQETAVTDGPTLGADIYKTIHSSKTLTSEQKAKLEQLLTETRQKQQKVTETSFKLKAVLVKELLSANIDKAEVKQLKRDIKKAESERIKNALESIEKISRIVGNDPDSQAYYENMLYIDRVYR